MVAPDENTPASTPAATGAVLVGTFPGQNPRVVKDAADYARMFGVPLAVAFVDTSHFVTVDDPAGFMYTAPIDITAEVGQEELDAVRAATAETLAGSSVTWEVHSLTGDPALALKHFADEIDARLIVVGTRRPGFGDSLREFFTGSVAARLSHRQSRCVLVVPVTSPLADDEPHPYLD